MKLSLQSKAAVASVVLALVLCMGQKSAFADSTVSATSSNWSGYIAQGATYTGVSGTWTIPTISPSATLASNATWVGIGGRTTPNLIQAGVYEIANSDGLTYQAWYELLPGDSVPVDLTVSPGDSLSVAILETSSGIWNIVITDNTTDQQFEKTVNYQSSLSSAEWIQERPLVNQVLTPLSAFTPVAFTGATVVQNSQRVNLAQANPELINLINSNGTAALAVPSLVGTDGASFTVDRTTAQDQSAAVTPSASAIPPVAFRRTGRRVTWVIKFPLIKL